MTVAARPLTGTVQERLTAIVASILRAPPQWLSASASFASLGLDSLGAVELTAAIEDELGVTVPLTAAHEYPSIETLARFIERGAEYAGSSRGRELMLADATLPLEIRPRPGRAAAASRARDILLTGATGFLGAYLLRALLDETTADIHCAVRCKPAENGKARVLANLAEYGLVRSDDEARIRVIRADLAQPMLGMPPLEFAGLAARVDAVYHCGAAVNWVYGYEELRDANVLGTRELLRIAAAGTKPFHFVSSIGVCHSRSAPAVLSESFDALTALDGVHLGYAQSKCVAEALVRQAAARGLPATIVRPSLVTGDARSGRSNAGDLTSRLVAGCIRMGAAPDLDWRLDCVPVDDAARSIVRLTLEHDEGLAVSHLTAKQPRHWRECVLWMRLAGYEIELRPYREWLDQLLQVTKLNHPLFPLRAFFATRVEDGMTLPELFEESRQPRVLAERTRAALCDAPATVADVDLDMLGRYFDDYVARRVIPDAPRRVSRATAATVPILDRRALAAGLSRRLGRPVTISSIQLERVSSDESIIAELTGWRGGQSAGLMRGELSFVDDAGVSGIERIFVKAKAADEQSIDVAESLGALLSPALGRALSAHRHRLGITRSHLRELAIYADDDPRIAAHRPAPVAMERDDAKKRWVLALESIDDAVLMNAISPAAWQDEAIEAALRGVASIHARWLGAKAALRSSHWLGPVRDAATWAEMTPLWQALADHAFSRPAWRDPALRSAHAACLKDLPSWSRALDDSPRTLIHNDFNPRNIAIRRRDDRLTLCAFDWELATIGAPQRDVAEFLCFVLRPDSPRDVVREWVERSRLLFNAAGQVDIDRARWARGFSAALCDLLVDRLAMLAMIDRVRPQSFLPRVVSTWLNLYDCFCWSQRVTKRRASSSRRL